MSVRLYDSAWIVLRDFESPQQVRKDPRNPAIFNVAGFQYDIDGNSYKRTETVPQIVQMLSMADAQALGLSTQYTAPRSISL